MTQGIVHDLQARVDVVFRLPGRPDLAIECVVDTGFAGALTLSPSAIAALGLPFFQEIEANLANDADVKTAVHIATIVWDGREAEVAVLAMGRRPLLGTAFLEGKRLCADFIRNGEVTIEAVESPECGRYDHLNDNHVESAGRMGAKATSGGVSAR